MYVIGKNLFINNSTHGWRFSTTGFLGAPFLLLCQKKKKNEKGKNKLFLFRVLLENCFRLVWLINFVNSLQNKLKQLICLVSLSNSLFQLLTPKTVDQYFIMKLTNSTHHVNNCFNKVSR